MILAIMVIMMTIMKVRKIIITFLQNSTWHLNCFDFRRPCHKNEQVAKSELLLDDEVDNDVEFDDDDDLDHDGDSSDDGDGSDDCEDCKHVVIFLFYLVN